MPELGRVLLVVGLMVALAGVYLMLGGKLPSLGRLSGDLVLERDGLTIYVPITTTILLSVLLTIVLQIVRR